MNMQKEHENLIIGRNSILEAIRAQGDRYTICCQN